MHRTLSGSMANAVAQRSIKLQESVSYALIDPEVGALSDNAKLAAELFAEVFVDEKQTDWALERTITNSFARAEMRTLAELVLRGATSRRVRADYVHGVHVVGNSIGRQIYGTAWRPRPPSGYYDYLNAAPTQRSATKRRRR